MCIQNLNTLALIEAEKFVTEKLFGEKEKRTNKGNDKKQHADSLLHNTTSHTHYVLTMYYISLLFSDIINVTLPFSHGFSTKCIGYNTICIGAHQIWMFNSINTVGITTNTLCRETVIKS